MDKFQCKLTGIKGVCALLWNFSCICGIQRSTSLQLMISSHGKSAKEIYFPCRKKLHQRAVKPWPAEIEANFLSAMESSYYRKHASCLDQQNPTTKSINTRIQGYPQITKCHGILNKLLHHIIVTFRDFVELCHKKVVVISIVLSSMSLVMNYQPDVQISDPMMLVW